MSLNFCDLLIVGSDLSGILAGTLLAKRGLSVLVLEDDEAASYQPNVLPGLESRLFKSILGKLMIPEGRLKVLKKNPVSYQVVLPKSRLDISDDPSYIFKEIGREFPEHVEFFDKFFGDIESFRKQSLEVLSPLLPIIDKKEKKKFLKLAKSLPVDKLTSLFEENPPEVSSFLKAQLQFLSQGVMMDPLLFQIFFLLSSESFSTYSIEGGLPALKKIFYEKIEYFGGTVQKSQEGYEIIVKKNEIKGVKLPQCRFVTRCRYLLGNTNIQNFYEQVPKSFRTRSTKKKTAKLTAQGHFYTVLYSIYKDRLPSPMKENLFLIGDPTKALNGLNYLQINLQNMPADVDADGDTLLSVSYMLPAHESEKTVPEFESMHEEITRKLEKLIPFSDGYLNRISPKVSEADDSLFPESSEDYALFRKESMQRVWHDPSFFFPTLTSPYQNLFTVGPNVLPWLGMEGKVMSAMKAVDQIWGQEIKIRNP